MEELLEQIPPRKANYLLWVGFVLFISSTLLMSYFITISGYAINEMIVGRLSFSGDVLKEHYKTIDINAFRIAQIFDFGIMIGYGLALFNLSLIIARRFDRDSIWRKSGVLNAILIIFTIWTDVMMNVFILLTLTNPAGFPEIWAILCSFFMLITLILLFVCASWFLSAAINLKIIKKLKKE